MVAPAWKTDSAENTTDAERRRIAPSRKLHAERQKRGAGGDGVKFKKGNGLQNYANWRIWINLTLKRLRLNDSFESRPELFQAETVPSARLNVLPVPSRGGECCTASICDREWHG
jgi:hypothetical protein